MQSDVLVVVECIRADCKALMNAFSKVSVNFIGRDLNVLAHRLVGYDMQVGNKSWFGYPLPLNDVIVSCNASVI